MKKGIYIKKGKRGWLWNIVGGNGKIVANGEEYASRSNALRAVNDTAALLDQWRAGNLTLFKEFPLKKAARG